MTSRAILVPLLLLTAFATPAEAAWCEAEFVNFTLHANGAGYYLLVEPSVGGPALWEESNGHPGLQTVATDDLCAADTRAL